MNESKLSALAVVIDKGVVCGQVPHFCPNCGVVIVKGASDVPLCWKVLFVAREAIGASLTPSRRPDAANGSISTGAGSGAGTGAETGTSTGMGALPKTSSFGLL